MKKLLLILLLLPIILYATPVSQKQAQLVGENFFSKSIQINRAYNTKANFISQQHSCMKKVRQNNGTETAPYYIFNNEGGGFVIVAGDDCATPILGYSTEGSINPNNMPIQLEEMLNAYAEEIQLAVENNYHTNDSIQALWDAYFREPQSRNATVIVDALITTTWYQLQYYNDKCPYDASLVSFGGHPATGCVATAMAQIMKYWEFPFMGIGNHSYNSTKYGTLSANFGRTQYDWANMPTKLTDSSSQEQIDAVSTLMYHCGVSVEMQYNSDGSGQSGAVTTGNSITKALKATAEEAFVDFWGYKADAIQGVFMNDYTYSGWISLLKTELDNRRPVLYAGSSQNGGHAFICDGYDSNDYFHFNWGWGGSSDGFFALSSTTNVVLYAQDQKAIIGIIPDQTSQEFDLAMYSDLATSKSTYNFGNDISITGQVENNGKGTFIGEFRVGLYNSNDQLIGWSNESYSFTLEGGKHTVAKTFTFTGGMPYITGKYTAYMFYRENGSSKWYSVRNDEGIFLTEYNNVSFNITYKPNTLRTYSAFISLENKYVAGSTTHVNVDVLNAGSSTFYGKIKLCLKNADGSIAQDIDVYNISSGLNANTHYSNGINFTGLITVDPGTYYLTLIFQKTGETTWYYVGCDQYQNPTPIIVVAPDLLADHYEENDTQRSAANLVPEFEKSELPTFGTDKVSLHTTTDIDYYKIDFPAGYKYYVSIDLYDIFNRNGSIYYSGDAKLAYSIDGETYSEYFDNGISVTNQISFEGPRTMYIKVIPYITDLIGTYEIAGSVIRERIEFDSQKYVIVANRAKDTDNNWYYMTSDLGTASNKRYQAVDAGTSILDNVTTSNLDAKYYWQIEDNKLHTANGYSTWGSGNTAILDNSGKELTIQQQTDGTYTFSFADGTETRYLSLNITTGNDYFAYYKGTNQVYRLTLIREGKSGTITDINEVIPDDTTPQKVMINGQIFIIRGDKTYTGTGQEVK